MRKTTTVNDFISIPVPEKLTFGEHVSTCMKAEAATFKTPDLPLTELDARLEKLRISFEAAQDGSRTERALMYQDEELVDNGLRVLSGYVDRIADGNEASILSSGVHLSKQPGPIEKPILSATNGKLQGTADLKRKAVTGAKSYLWQFSVNGADWELAGASTTAKFTVTGLTSVMRYYFRVAAITTEGTTAYTDPVALVIQ